jgi:hypothetical protein
MTALALAGPRRLGAQAAPPPRSRIAQAEKAATPKPATTIADKPQALPEAMPDPVSVPTLPAETPPTAPGASSPPPFGGTGPRVDVVEPGGTGTERADDPEKEAGAYVEKTRREATAAVKALRDEAEALRARLKKVEAGLRRWEALLSALDPEGHWEKAEHVTAEGSPPVQAAEPAVLEPVPSDVPPPTPPSSLPPTILSTPSPAEPPK